MKRKQLFFDILITFFAAIFLGIILSVGTYFWTVNGPNFEIGFPRTYYYQFQVDHLHHGCYVDNFIFDGIMTWVSVACGWVFLKKINTPAHK